MLNNLTSTPWGQAATGVAFLIVLALVWLYLTRSIRAWVKRRLGYIQVEGLKPFLERAWVLFRFWGLLFISLFAFKVAGALAPSVYGPLTKAVFAILIVLVGATVTGGVWHLIGHFLGTAKTPQPLIRFTQVTALLSFSYLTLITLLAEVDLSITPLFGLGTLGVIPLLLVLREAASDLFFYFRLLRREHLRVGDFVRLENGVAGHVESVTWQDVRIRTKANNLVVIPNRRLAKLIVTNLHLPEKRVALTIPISVTGGVSPEVIETILREEFQQAAQDLPGLASDVPTELHWASGKSKDGFTFIAVCQVEEAELSERIEQEVFRRVALRFSKEEIQSPLLDSVTEGVHPITPLQSREDLEFLVTRKFADTKFVVVSNAEPYRHSYDGRSIRWIQPASGLITALDPVMRVLQGTWIAVANGDADREASDAQGRLTVPPNNPSYTLRRLWLSKEQMDRYYYGFSNKALWPLCHTVYVRPTFAFNEWKAYKEVNELFANAILEEIDNKKAFVFLQDFHLSLVPRLLKEAGAPVTAAHFWHIPWPAAEAFQTCPWAEPILEGLLKNDLIGFHTRYHCNNFLETVDKTLECKVDYGSYSVTRHNHQTLVRPFPISIDFKAISQGVDSAPVQREQRLLRRELSISEGAVGLGVERLDYTKGIPERLRAIDLLLETHPKYKGRFTFIQVGVPSRSQIREYRDIDDEVNHAVEEINRRHQMGSWRPIIYLRRYFSAIPLWALYSLADLCIVSSLHDGMNLVAKEYVAAKAKGDGVLILSKFAGAATELTGAIKVNPYDIEQLAQAIVQALEMPVSERQQRMLRMRAYLQENDIYRWAIRVFNELSRIETPAILPSFALEPKRASI